MDLGRFYKTEVGWTEPEELDLVRKIVEARRFNAAGGYGGADTSKVLQQKYGQSPLALYANTQTEKYPFEEGKREALKRVARDLSVEEVPPWEMAKAMPGAGARMLWSGPGLKNRALGAAVLGLSPLMLAGTGLDRLLGQESGYNMDPGILSLTPTPGMAAMMVGGGPSSVLGKAGALAKNYGLWTAAAVPAVGAGEYLREHGSPGAAAATELALPLLGAHVGGRLLNKLSLNNLIDRDFSSLTPLLTNERGAMSISPSALSSAWQSTVGSKLTSLGQKLGSIGLTSRNSRFSNWMGGNTLNEWALSPLERMDQDAAQLFRNANAEAQRTGEALKSSAVQLKNLNLEERESLREVLKYNFNIAKATPGTQAKISSLLQPVADANAITHRKLYTTPQQALVVEDHLNDALMKIFQEDATMGNWQLLKQNTQHDLTTPKGTLAFLDDVMRNKLYPPEVKRLALDYYDLPAKTAFEVGDAHRKAYEQLLYHEIVNNPKFSVLQADFLNQIHQAQLAGNTTLLKQLNKQLDDFVVIAGENDPALGDRIVIPSLSKAFDGLYVHRDVAEGLRDLNTHITNLRLGWNKYFLNPWKMSKVVLQVPARLRDLINNFMFNDIYGKNPLSPFRLDVYGGALNDIRRAAKGQNIPELESFFYHTGGKMDALNSVATDPIFAAMKHDAGILDNLLGYFYSNPVSSAMSSIIRNIDFWAKYSKYKHNLASGKFGSEEEAIVDALRATGNMMEQPRAVRNVRDTILPFFGWTAHAAKTVARGLVDHPIRTAKWYLGPVLAGQYAVGELGMSQQEYEDFKTQLPSYMQSSALGVPSRIPLPWRDEKGRIQMMDIGWWLPGVQDFAEMDSAWSNPLRVIQNPAATLFASLTSNKKFSGAPIWNEWDDPGTKWAKGLGYTAQQLMPPLTPVVGTQASKMWEAYKNEDPDAPTMAQALGTQIGARIQPIDQDQAYLKNQARLRAWQNEAKHQMREELSETADPAEQEAVVNKYQNILNRLQAEESGLEEEE